MFVITKVVKNVIVISAIFLASLVIKFFDFHDSDIQEQDDRKPLPRNIKYILKHSPTDYSPFLYIPDGHDIFIQRNCSVSNCYFTSNRSILRNIVDFHAVLVLGSPAVRDYPYHYLPKERTPNQSYIFVSTESADNHYVSDDRYNKAFNFTWTYKLNSDINYGYMFVRNEEGKVIGPKENMSWISIDDMKPIKESVKQKLQHKKVAAAWFVSNCHTNNKRESKALLIYEELLKYKMSVDIFGDCTYKRCPRQYMSDCLQMLQRDYYFYFAFENSMSDDYVTEKLLYALQNYAVPVVFGGADYTRFMPDGIYINAREMSAKNIAKLMVEIINDKNRYYDYFKWHSHYTYQYPEGISDIDSFCEFCEFINNVNPNGNIVIDDFYNWWNPHVAPVQFEMNESFREKNTLKSYFRRVKKLGR